MPNDLDYVPTRKITNLIKKLINDRARFSFGKLPYFDVRTIHDDTEGSTMYQDQAQEKEDLLYDILTENKFHSKLLKARKDCSIGGKVAIKLWAAREEGLKIVFSPAQEFFTQYNEDDVDVLEKVIFIYGMNTEDDPERQRIKKQSWEMVGNKCILNEGVYNGRGEVVRMLFEDYNTGLDFIPVIIIQNGGLTGETEGESDVAELWSNQDAYNRLISDDIDALRFQMFGQNVVTDADESSIKNMKIAPSALIDLQTDPASTGGQARAERLESKFTYNDKFVDTINRIKNDMYDTLDVPNVGLEQLKGLMQSGKSMKALYWGLMSACHEDFTEWGPALTEMADFIFRMVDIYNLYGARKIAKYETNTTVELVFPIQENEDDLRRVGMDEVTTGVKSRKTYIKEFGGEVDPDAEIEQIRFEKSLLEDSYAGELIPGDGNVE